MVFITSEEHLVAGEKTEGVRGHLRYQLRKAAVLAVHSGRSVAQVAADYNVAVRSLYDWLRCQRLGGWEALEEGKRDGRPRKAGSVAEQWMTHEILEGKAVGLWSLDRMVESLQRDCGVRVSKNTAHRLLRRAGVSFGDTNDWKVLRVLGGRFPGAPRRGGAGRGAAALTGGARAQPGMPCRSMWRTMRSWLRTAPSKAE